MTNEQLNDWLATDVMGWIKHYGWWAKENYGDQASDAQIEVFKWNPPEDLKQAVMCANRFCNKYTDKQNYFTWHLERYIGEDEREFFIGIIILMCAPSWEKRDFRIGKEAPALALCLAIEEAHKVVKA